jgi:hypothetical protein
MPQLDPTAVLSQFLGTLTTFIAVLLAWMNTNARISALNGRFSDQASRFDKRLDDMKETLRADLRRVEEVIDARLSHLEKER